MSEPGPLDHLREVRDAIRMILADQLHTIDQLLQRSAVLLGAASVLAGLLAALGIDVSIPTWRKWTTVVAFAALLVSIFAGIVAVWPRQIKQSLPKVPVGTSVAGVQTYAKMNPAAFIMSQGETAFNSMARGDYADIIKFRRRVFQLQAVALVIGGALIALNGLITTIQISPSTPPRPPTPTPTRPPTPTPTRPPTPTSTPTDGRALQAGTRAIL
jgi:hypothetical protein